jgi:hypothetical protein
MLTETQVRNAKPTARPNRLGRERKLPRTSQEIFQYFARTKLENHAFRATHPEFIGSGRSILFFRDG